MDAPAPSRTAWAGPWRVFLRTAEGAWEGDAIGAGRDRVSFSFPDARPPRVGIAGEARVCRGLDVIALGRVVVASTKVTEGGRYVVGVVAHDPVADVVGRIERRTAIGVAG